MAAFFVLLCVVKKSLFSLQLQYIYIYMYMYIYIYIDFHVKKYTIQKKKAFPKKCTRHSLKGLPQSSDDLRCWRWRYLPPSEVKMMYMIDTSILYSRYSMSKTYGWIANSLAAWPIWITTRYSSILPTLDVLYHQFYHWNWSSRHSWNSQKKKTFEKLCTLRLLTPPMETPDPPNDTPGALKQVVLTPHDIPWSLRAVTFPVTSCLWNLSQIFLAAVEWTPLVFWRPGGSLKTNDQQPFSKNLCAAMLQLYKAKKLENSARFFVEGIKILKGKKNMSLSCIFWGEREGVGWIFWVLKPNPPQKWHVATGVVWDWYGRYLSDILNFTLLGSRLSSSCFQKGRPGSHIYIYTMV